jgi:thymidylate synthase
MTDRNKPTETMSPDEKFAAVANLKDKLEENFISLGQLLSEIKRSKLFLYKGYEKFKDFVEAEYQLSGSLAGKLVGTHDLFIEEMDVDEEEVKQIGFDRLNMIKPLIQKADWKLRDEWLHKAEDMPTKELRDHIKELKKQEKEADVDLKKVYVEQYMEKMISWFNCSRQELNFKLALYFQDADLDEMKQVVKERQRRFEQETQNKE